MSKVVKIRGADRVGRTMHRAAKDLRDADEPTRDYGELLARTAQGYAPKRTGALRGAIVVNGSQVIAGVRYAAAVEYGSKRRGIAGARFVGRALTGTDHDRDRIFERWADDTAGQIKGA